MCAVVNWDENLPSGSSAVRLGDDDLRSLTTSLRQALADEHTWPTGPSVAERGKHTPNASRVSYGGVGHAAPLSPPSDATGLMFQEAAGTGGRLWTFPNDGTSDRSIIVGGGRVVLNRANPGTAQVFTLSAFTMTPGSAASLGVTFADDPTVTLSVQTTSSISFAMTITSLDTVNITVETYQLDGGVEANLEIVHVLALGPVAT